MVSKYNQLIDKMYEDPKNDPAAGEVAEDKPKSLKTTMISLVKGKASIFSKLFIRGKEFYHAHTVDFKYLLLAIPIIATFFIVEEVLRTQSLKRSAAMHQIQISIEPASASMPSDTTFTVWFSSDIGVGFANTLITFDPSLLKLSSDAIVDPAHLSRIVKVTSLAEANSTGKIRIITALDPTKRDTPPVDVFQLATLSFSLVSTAPNMSTTIGIDTGSSQIVAMDETMFDIIATSANITLNPTSTDPPSTTIATPTDSPTPKPTKDPCLSCFKKACNGVCEKNDRPTCPDCL